MERILAHFREIEYNQHLSQIKTANETLAYFFDELYNLCQFDITPEIASELLLSNNCDLTEQAIKEKIESDLKKAGLTIKAISDAAIKNAFEDFYKLYNAYTFKRNTYSIALSGLEVHENQLRIKPDFINNLKDQYSIYVTTEAGKKLMDAHNAIFEAVKKFLSESPTRCTLNNAFTVQFDGTIEKNIWDYDFLTA